MAADAEEFLGPAAFLEQRLEHNLLAWTLSNVLDGVYAVPPDSRRGELRFAALRTPPWPLLVAELEPALAPQFIAQWLESDPEPSCVNGQAETTRAIAAACQELAGGSRRGRRPGVHAGVALACQYPLPTRGY